MAVTLKIPFFEDQVSVTVAGYSEAGSLLQSSIALTESAVPGLYTGSLSFATFPVGYYDMRVYIGAATVASASWAIRVTADGTTADYADSIGELKRWATNQTEHDATQASITSSLAITVLPLTGTTPDRTQGTTISVFVGEVTPISMLVEGATLTGKTLQFVVEDKRRTDITVIEDGDISRTTNTFTVTVPSSVTERGASHIWSLRDISGSGNTVLLQGVFEVNYAADMDAP
jgi:hypothetical protein